VADEIFMKKTPFDIERLQMEPLQNRRHDLDLSVVQPLRETAAVPTNLTKAGEKIVRARNSSCEVILMIGAHVVRSGAQTYLIDLVQRGYISCVTVNGAVVIHDFELALIGATTESVARYIAEGQFGLWQETGRINDIVNATFPDGPGMGEAVGKAILEGDFPHKDISIMAQAFKYNVPVTVHVGIGYDIIHEHPNFDGAATGAASYRDFLTFAGAVEKLEGGVVMNFGSAVMAPEVFLKALSMARNVARQQDKVIRNFTTLVCDLYPLPEKYSEEALKDSPAYYFRPWKTMLVRTVADGGEGLYVQGPHADTIPALWTAVNNAEIELSQKPNWRSKKV